MSLYEFFKTIHILGAAAWAGAVIYSQFLAFLASRSKDPQRMLGFMEDEAWLGKHYFAPTSIITLLAGIAMVIESGWEFTDAWIVIGLVLFFVTVLLGMLVLSPKSEQAVAAIREKGLDDPGVKAQVDQLMTLSRIDLGLLVVIIADMVIKPGA
jgi:uncharacterized membrane protein